MGSSPPKPPSNPAGSPSRLAATTAAVQKSLADYRFDEAASAIYQFFWGDFCDWYLEIVKLRLNFDNPVDLPQTKLALTTLLGTFESALRLLSPFMPFITEEIWQAFWPQLALDPPAKSIALTRYPTPADSPRNGAESSAAMQLLQDLIVSIRGLRKELAVPEKEPASIRLYASENRTLALVNANADFLHRLARVAAIDFSPASLTGPTARTTTMFDVEVLYERTVDIPAERDRLTKELAKLEKGLQAADRQLTNDAFMAKAPAHIIEGLRKQSTETRLQYDKAKAALEALS